MIDLDPQANLTASTGWNPLECSIRRRRGQADLAKVRLETSLLTGYRPQRIVLTLAVSYNFRIMNTACVKYCLGRLSRIIKSYCWTARPL
jgi:hypothetical protein